MKINLIKLITILRHPFYRKALLVHGVAAAVEHEVLLQSIGSELRTVVDIGANRGQFALAARINAPYARLISFEPLEEPAARYRLLFQADRNTVLYQLAIGPQKVRQFMHVSRRDDSSSLLPISKMQPHLFRGTEERETRMVDVSPLAGRLDAEALISPALLKIDVQGYELEVLKGCQPLLTGFNFVLVECSYVPLYTGQALAGEVREYLEQSGFTLSGIYNLSHDGAGNPVQGDFFFHRS